MNLSEEIDALEWFMFNIGPVAVPIRREGSILVVRKRHWWSGKIIFEKTYKTWVEVAKDYGMPSEYYPEE